MKIILTFKIKDDYLDFQLDDEIRIIEAIEIIKQSNGNMDWNISHYIFSKRKKEMINVNYTFHQAKIYTGDVLIMEESK